MKKEIIMLEALSRSRRSKLLRMIEKTMNMLELITLIIPSIKKFNKTSQVFVVSEDYEILKFLERFGINTIKLSDKKFNKEEMKVMLRKSIELSEQWRQYKDMNDKITYLNANLGVILQQELADLFFDAIKRSNDIQGIIDEIEPNSIYLDNINSSLGQIVLSVAEKNEIKVFQILPRLYGIIKNNVRKYMLYTRTIIPSIYHGTAHILAINDDKAEFKILVDVPYINFIDALFPVIKVLSGNKNHKIYVFGEKEEIRRYSRDFVEIPIKIETAGISKEVAAMKRYLSQIFKDEAFHEIFEYEGINFWKSVELDIHYILYNRLKSMVLNLKEHDTVIENIDPNIVLVGDDRTGNVRTCVLLAKNRKIPVVEIQHGMYMYMQHIVTPISDKIYVWGDYAKDVLKKAGGTEDQIVVTGCPKFDPLFDKKKHKFMSKREEQCKKILFATQFGFEDVTGVVIEKIIQFMSAKDDVYLVIKPHPAEKTALYRRFAEKNRKVIVEDSKANIDNLILDADVLITISSTVGIHAAALDVPMILLNFDKIPSPYIPISLEVREMKDVIPAIKNALYNKEVLQQVADARGKFIYKHAYKIDGKASERVADLIEKMLRERREKR